MRGIAIISAGLMILLSCKEETPAKLPYIGNYDLSFREENGKEITDTIYPKIPAFKYLNQDSVWISSAQMKGKVWIADFFFTSCTTICPKMTNQMKRLNLLTKDLSEEVQYLSFSINPTTDTPARLRAYRERFGIKAHNWHFFTGDEAATHELGDQHFLVNARPDLGSEGGYAHSEAFVLVDHEGYIRGMYNGTDTKEVNRLNHDLRILLKYEYQLDIAE